MEENIFNVPKKQWKKWNEAERKMFNDLNEIMLNSQLIYIHPMTFTISSRQWSTTAWNAARTAADLMREARKNG